MVEHYLNILSGVNYHTREAKTFIFHDLRFYKQLAGCMHESIIIKDVYCFALEMTITRNRESQTLNKQ